MHSNRDVKYDTSKYVGPAINGFIPMREAAELRLRDERGGAATLSLLTLGQTFELKPADGAALHTLNRKLAPLFHNLSLSIRKEVCHLSLHLTFAKRSAASTGPPSWVLGPIHRDGTHRRSSPGRTPPAPSPDERLGAHQPWARSPRRAG